MRPFYSILLAAVLTAGVAIAQDAPTPAAPAAEPVAPVVVGAAPGADPLAPAHGARARGAHGGRANAHDAVLAAIHLPQAAIALRAAGYSAPDVRRALVAMHAKGLPVDQASELFQRTADLAAATGSVVPEFGAFVERELKAGKRGRELGLAIRDAAGGGAGAHGDGPKAKAGGRPVKAGRAGKAAKVGKAGKPRKAGKAGKGGKGGRKGAKGDK